MLSSQQDIIQTYSVEDNREETTINFPANNSENEQEFQCETNDFEVSMDVSKKYQLHNRFIKYFLYMLLFLSCT